MARPRWSSLASFQALSLGKKNTPRPTNITIINIFVFIKVILLYNQDMKKLIILSVLALIAFFLVKNLKVPEFDIVVTSPKPGETVSSPLEVLGEAKGPWYFEASAPVDVLDAEGKILGRGYIEAQGEWMTTDFVPFRGVITFEAPLTSKGEIVFKNDNPSGDPVRDKFFRVPVKFEN